MINSDLDVFYSNVKDFEIRMKSLQIKFKFLKKLMDNFIKETQKTEGDKNGV